VANTEETTLQAQVNEQMQSPHIAQAELERSSRGLQGLRCRLGILDEGAYRQHLEPVFAAVCDAQDHEPLLQLAESLLDALELLSERAAALSEAVAAPVSTADALEPGSPMQGDPVQLSEAPALQALRQLSEAWLDCAQEAEDAGLSPNALGASPWAVRFFALRDGLVRWLLEHSAWVAFLLGEQSDEPASAAATRAAPSIVEQSCEQSRHCLQFCLSIAAGVHTFSAASLTHRDYLSQLTRLRSSFEMMSLVSGDWTEWPPFEPDRVLSTGGVADYRFETPNDFDWTLRSAAATRRVAEQFRQVLRRFVHLEYLRLCRAELFAELDELLQDGLDEVALQAYDSLFEQVPWTPPFAECWRYLSGERDSCPQPLPPFYSLSGFTALGVSEEDEPDSVSLRHEELAFRAVEQALKLYRELLAVVQAAEARGAGLYILLF
jgi:hypothetical protein